MKLNSTVTRRSDYVKHLSHQGFTCSKLVTETLEQRVKCSKLTMKTPERHQANISYPLIGTRTYLCITGDNKY